METKNQTKLLIVDLNLLYDLDRGHKFEIMHDFTKLGPHVISTVVRFQKVHFYKGIGIWCVLLFANQDKKSPTRACRN